MVERFDVIVVGGGHAGTEAALASARMGARTLLLTHNIETIGQMSCNPAIGGIGKGHLVREIDALGGVMARAADHAGIHWRTLNARKGPAVRATRSQCDRALYKAYIREAIETQENLCVFQQAADDLIVSGDQVHGVITQMGLRIYGQAVVLTAGTFLAGKIHVGPAQSDGGRMGDAPALRLAGRMRELMPRVSRLKTGTPPRIDGRSIDYSAMEVQPGDEPRPVFSFMGDPKDHPPQRVCHITRTNPHTHEIIAASLDRSPLYTGQIEGVGPRYCPSIEDKIVRFADKDSHQIFVEPEGLRTTEVYPNGISTSLPHDVQLAVVRSIRGFEKAHITRPGYAIEYDFFDPRDLRPSLETRRLSGLFFAGQINGTTGYEEAAAQGLVAGINAARHVFGLPSWIPRRDQAYMGVLIDDLIARGTQEPYRMFTSRAEYRLLLREDNADLRLTPLGRELGLVDDVRWRAFEAKRNAIEREQLRCAETLIKSEALHQAGIGGPTQMTLNGSVRVQSLLCRPGITLDFLEESGLYTPLSDDQTVREQVEIQYKYAGYIDRQQNEIKKRRAHEESSIPEDMDFSMVAGLSHEARQLLENHRPSTVGQAARIAGVTPAAISLLLIHLRKRHGQHRSA